MSSQSTTSYTVAALAKGLRVLAILARESRGLRHAELAELTGLPQPTVFRILKTLEEEGYVEQAADRRYRPGLAVLRLGFAALRAADLVELAAEPLGQLAERTQETVNLGVLVEGSVIYTNRILKQSLVTATVQVGAPLPAPCNSIGKVLLAALDDATLEQLAPKLDFGSCVGPHAHSSLAELLTDLTKVRARGWSLQDEEVAYGVRSVAAPVRDAQGAVVAAVSLPVQSSQWSRDVLVERFLPALMETVEAISAKLGFSGEWPQSIVPAAPSQGPSRSAE